MKRSRNMQEGQFQTVAQESRTALDLSENVITQQPQSELRIPLKFAKKPQSRKITVLRTINRTVIQDKQQNKKALKALKQIMSAKNRAEFIERDQLWKKGVKSRRQSYEILSQLSSHSHTSQDTYYQAKGRRKRLNSYEMRINELLKSATSAEYQNVEVADFQHLADPDELYEKFYTDTASDFILHDTN